MTILNYINLIAGIVGGIALIIILMLLTCYVKSTDKSLKNMKLSILSICSIGCVLLFVGVMEYKMSMENSTNSAIKRGLSTEQLEGLAIRNDQLGLDGTISLASSDIDQGKIIYGSETMQVYGYIYGRLISNKSNDSDYSNGDAASNAAKAAMEIYEYTARYKMYYIAQVLYNGQLVSFNIVSVEDDMNH